MLARVNFPFGNTNANMNQVSSSSLHGLYMENACDLGTRRTTSNIGEPPCEKTVLYHWCTLLS